MKANKLMIGNLVRVSKDVCFKKGTIVKVRGIDADNVFTEKGLKGSATCVAANDPDRVTCGVWCDYLEPIPLTAEILEKNGFRIEEEYDEIYDIHNYYATLNSVDSEKRNVEVNYRTFGNEITIFCHDRQNVLLYRSLETQIKHVHELQHIFKILKIEKEIVL